MALSRAETLGVGRAVQVCRGGDRESRFQSIWLRNMVLDAATRAPTNTQGQMTRRDLPGGMPFGTQEDDNGLPLLLAALEAA